MDIRVTAGTSKVEWDFDVIEAKDWMVSELFDDLERNLERYRMDPRDDEAVHDIRMDIRKLTSLLYFFKPLIEAEKERDLKRMLREVLKSFGSIREGDMLVKSVKEFLEKDERFQIPAEALITQVEKGREEDVAKSLERIGSNDLQNKVSDLKSRMLKDDLLREDNSDKGRKLGGKAMMMEPYAERRFRRVLGKLRELASADEFGDIAAVHAFRIRCKKASYSLMLAETVTTLDGREWIRKLKEIQDVTGNIHDAQVNMELLEKRKVEDRDFREAYTAYLERIIRKRMETFEDQLEGVRKSKTMLKRRR